MHCYRAAQRETAEAHNEDYGKVGLWRYVRINPRGPKVSNRRGLALYSTSIIHKRLLVARLIFVAAAINSFGSNRAISFLRVKKRKISLFLGSFNYLSVDKVRERPHSKSVNEKVLFKHQFLLGIL